MCDSIKDTELLKKQYKLAKSLDIEIIEIEFISGRVRLRDRWSVEKILDRVYRVEREHEQPKSNVSEMQV